MEQENQPIEQNAQEDKEKTFKQAQNPIEKKSESKKVLLYILLGVIVVAIIGVGAWYIMNKTASINIDKEILGNELNTESKKGTTTESVVKLDTPPL